MNPKTTKLGPNLFRKQTILIVLAALLLTLTPPAFGFFSFSGDPDDETAGALGSAMGDAIGSTAHFLSDSRANMAGGSREIQAAREKFWKAYVANSPDKAAAGAEYFGKLFAKDLYYLNLAFLVESATKRLPTGADLDKIDTLTGSLDGGIRPAVRGRFLLWVDDFEKHGGPPMDSPFDIPGRYVQALQASQKSYQAYRLARDWAEMDAQGITYPPRDFLRMLFLVEADGDKDSADRTYQAYADEYGQDLLLEVATKLCRAPVNTDGHIADPAALGIILPKPYDENVLWHRGLPRNNTPVPPGMTIGSVNRWGAFSTLLLVRGSDHQFFIYIDNNPYPKEDYRRWVAVYGTNAVNAVLERLRQAPKAMEDGLLADPAALGLANYDLYQAFTELMYQSAKDSPALNIRRFIAFDGSSSSTTNLDHLDDLYQQMISQYGEQSVFDMYAKVRAVTNWPENKFGVREVRPYRALLRALKTHGESLNFPAPDMVDNIFYKSWVGFQPGDSVRFVSHNLDPTMAPSRETEEIALKSIDDHAADVTFTDARITDGREEIQDSIPVTESARVNQAKLPNYGQYYADVLSPAQPAGQKTLQVDGRTLVCQCYMRDVLPKQTWEQTEHYEIYLCNDVPGGMVRRYETYGGKPFWETMLVSFKSSKTGSSSASDTPALCPPLLPVTVAPIAPPPAPPAYPEPSESEMRKALQGHVDQINQQLLDYEAATHNGKMPSRLNRGIYAVHIKNFAKLGAQPKMDGSGYAGQYRATYEFHFRREASERLVETSGQSAEAVFAHTNSTWVWVSGP